MKKKPLFWHLFPAFLSLEVITLVAVAWFSVQSFRTFHYDRTRDSLESIARLSSLQISDGAPQLRPADVNALCSKIGPLGRARLTVVTPDGSVIADTDHAPGSMDDHADRPEVLQAWKTGVGARIRRSGTLQESMMYVAVSLRSGNADVAVIRASRPLDDINHAVEQLARRVILFGLLVAALGAVLALFVARAITRPLDQIRHSTEAHALGTMDHKLPSSSVSEVDVLTSALNRMSEDLNNRIGMITRQRDEENALLSCMTEAVLAVDTDRHLLKMNAAARTLFKVETVTEGEIPIAEVIRNSDLLQIVDKALSCDEPVEGDILIPDRERYLQATGTVLADRAGHHIGAVIVINDVTRLRRLATMRRDFVANVSHELKTPITSIKGFAETLLEEAPQGDENLVRFLGIISTQADRLQSIVEDLLALAEIENSAEKNSIEFTKVSVRRVIENAVATQSGTIAGRDIELVQRCDDSCYVNANLQLLEQAVGNLINNAAKYSPEHSRVVVSSCCEGDQVLIVVRDEGPGIASKHLPRLFERFYRVDKSRSRKLGGTGLGLAIVKRVALAHGGSVQVESELGKGSAFTIALPLVS
jgi:two-component system, OmpR family, phosphate regulon sensor histidine kinase PhoR